MTVQSIMEFPQVCTLIFVVCTRSTKISEHSSRAATLLSNVDAINKYFAKIFTKPASGETVSVIQFLFQLPKLYFSQTHTSTGAATANIVEQLDNSHQSQRSIRVT